METDGFTQEEWMLLCIHSAMSKHYDRPGLTDYLRDLRTKTGRSRKDQNLRRMIDGALAKMGRMTDEEFSELNLIPDLGGML